MLGVHVSRVLQGYPATCHRWRCPAMLLPGKSGPWGRGLSSNGWICHIAWIYPPRRIQSSPPGWHEPFLGWESQPKPSFKCYCVGGRSNIFLWKQSQVVVCFKDSWGKWFPIRPIIRNFRIVKMSRVTLLHLSVRVTFHGSSPSQKGHWLTQCRKKCICLLPNRGWSYIWLLVIRIGHDCQESHHLQCYMMLIMKRV